MSFLAELISGGLLMDGAVGSQLLQMGLRYPVARNLEAPDRVRSIHAAYARAGARVHLTNTFQLNPVALSGQGLATHLVGIARKALNLARTGAPDGWILGDIGPIVAPGRHEEFTDYEALTEVLEASKGPTAFCSRHAPARRPCRRCSSPCIAFPRSRVCPCCCR